MWDQHYNPLGNAALSTIAAAVPVVTLLVLIASGRLVVLTRSARSRLLALQWR